MEKGRWEENFQLKEVTRLEEEEEEDDMDRYTVRLRPQAFASRTQCLIFRPQALYNGMVNCKLLACRSAVGQSLKEY